MLPKLLEAKYQGDYRIWLKFEDGVEFAFLREPPRAMHFYRVSSK